MANSSDRHHSQTTDAVTLHCIAAKQSRVTEKGIVLPNRQHMLKRFCGPDCFRTAQPTRWLGPEFTELSAETDRIIITLAARRTWLVFWTPPCRLQRRLKMPTPVLGLYESASVEATVTSHDRDCPVCHGIKVGPSGRLPSLRERPVGSFAIGILHCVNKK